MSESQSPEPSSDRQRDLRRPVLIGLLVVVVLLAVGAVVLLRQDAEDAQDAAGESSATTSAAAESSAPATDGTSVPPTEPPPTEAAPTQTTAGEQPTTEPTDAEQAAEPAPAGVLVLVTSQQFNTSTTAIEVVGTVQGAATTSSQCTAVATMGGVQVTAGVAGMFDGGGTSCGLISIPMSGQPGGTWSVVITFEYAGGTATSEPVQVNIPG